MININVSNPPGSTNKAKGHRKVAFCFIVVSRRMRSTVRGSAGACAASGDNAQRGECSIFCVSQVISSQVDMSV